MVDGSSATVSCGLGVAAFGPAAFDDAFHKSPSEINATKTIAESRNNDPLFIVLQEHYEQYERDWVDPVRAAVLLWGRRSDGLTSMDNQSAPQSDTHNCPIFPENEMNT